MSLQGEKLSGTLCIFAKTPALGKVKTRLESTLGVQSCLKLHKWLVEDRLKTFVCNAEDSLLVEGPLLVEDSLSAEGSLLTEGSSFDVRLFVTEDIEDPYWLGLNSHYSISTSLQQGNTLGERMLNAVENTLGESDWVILIGADCPDLDVGYVQSAIKKLEEGQDVVIGPAEDGGYVLLGLRKPVREIFYDIDWGTSSVFSQTMCILDKLGIRATELMPLRDLDVFEDYLFYSDKITELSEFIT